MTDAFQPFAVGEIGSFHVGGRMVRLAGTPPRERAITPGGSVHHVGCDGEMIAGQMYVQFVRLDGPKAMWHGGGMTGVL